MNNFRQDGSTLELKSGVPDNDPAAIKSGQVIAIGNLLGVAVADQRERCVAVSLEGVFRFNKPMGNNESIRLGDRLYWDSENNRAVKTRVSASGLRPILGTAWSYGKTSGIIASESAMTVDVRLDPDSPPTVQELQKATAADTWNAGVPIYQNAGGTVDNAASHGTFIGFAAIAATTGQPASILVL